MPFFGFLLACAVACAGQTTEEPRQFQLPVSVERIQERLKRPPALELAVEPHADFRASVTEDYDQPRTVLEALRLELAGDLTPRRIIPGIAPTLVSVDVLHRAMLLKQRLSAALRARAARRARKDVDEALAEFCASNDCAVLNRAPENSRPEGILTH